MNKRILFDLMKDEFVAQVVELESNGKEDDVEALLAEYAAENGMDYEDIRRMYGDELTRQGLY